MLRSGTFKKNLSESLEYYICGHMKIESAQYFQDFCKYSQWDVILIISLVFICISVLYCRVWCNCPNIALRADKLFDASFKEMVLSDTVEPIGFSLRLFKSEFYVYELSLSLYIYKYKDERFYCGWIGMSEQIKVLCNIRY